MRDKYINVIKEYIRLKPEYKNTLDKLKEDVLLIGATEEEFDEAIKQIESSQPPSTSEKITYIEKLNNALKPKKKKINPKIIVVIASCILVIFLLSIFQNNFVDTKKPEKISIISPSPVIEEKTSLNPFPLVYASTKSVDAEKVFSIPSDSVKLTVTSKPKKEIFGFFPYWMLTQEDKISLSYLTSLSLFGLTANGKGNIIKVNAEGKTDGGWDMWQNPKLDTLIKKAKNQNVKVYLTIKAFNNNDIESISFSDAAQKDLIANIIFLVNSKNLNGVNIDFEYSGEISALGRDGFSRFIKNLNNELKRQIPNSVLTIDTYLTSGSNPGLFDLLSLASNSDAFVIMGYDIHTPLGDPGPVSAMGGNLNLIGYVQNYLEKVDSKKIILAVPYYGYDWSLKTPDTSTKILSYAEIAQASKQNILAWDEVSLTPSYRYNDGENERVVHFDNVRSLGIKYDFINNKDLKGVGIWALGYDGLNTDLQKLMIDKFISE